MLCGAAVVTVAAVVQLAQSRDATVDVQVLAINDFHGALEPASDGNGRIASTDAGGIEYLATHLARLKATNPNTIIVSAGDNIGGTPLFSSLSHDEATVEGLNHAGIELSALGNHDLDEGWWELYRIQQGGCHPVDGCQDGTPYDGARFQYLAANVTLDPRRADPAMLARAGIQGAEPRPLLPGYVVREMDGVRVGFIGLELQDAPGVILASSIVGLTFGPEADAANKAAAELLAQGVRAVVVMVHDGLDGTYTGVNGCENLSGRFLETVKGMSDDIDVVLSAHSHLAYNCTIGRKLVTSAASSGRLITDVDLKIQRSTGEVIAKSARNMVVSRDVPKDASETALLEHYRPFAEKEGGRVVGSITAPLTRMDNAAGESALGDVIADALLEATRKVPGARAEIAFWNPGGIRADLPAKAGAATTPVTYAELFSVLPFGNILITKSVTGDMLLQMLELRLRTTPRLLQFSDGFSYAYDPSRPAGQRVDRASVRINGAPLNPQQQYRVATSNFLWDGGEGNVMLRSATDAATVGVDVDLVAEYFSSHSPVRPGPQNRIRRIR